MNKVVVGLVLALTACGVPQDELLYSMDQSLVQVAPAADAQVRSGSYANTNYGSSSSVEVDQSSSSTVMEGYLRFDLSGVGPVSKATLRLYVTNDSADSADVYAISNASWSESSITWNNKPAVDGAKIATVGQSPYKAWIELDVTQAISGNALSLAVKPRSSDGFAFASKESGSYKPQLKLELASATVDAGTPAPEVDAGTPMVDAGTPVVDAGTPGGGGTDAGTSTGGGTDAGTPGSGSGYWPVLKAFPSAEGFGTQTPGGRGGTVIAVTNLNDSGPGSFRAAVTASGPRLVVFKVSGTISLLSRIVVSNPYLTVAGQTAPGGGITLRADPSNLKGIMYIQTHDVVMRHIRFRTGTPSGATDTADNLTVWHPSDPNAVRRVVLDHCSFSWAIDENLATYHNAREVTFSWNIVSEALSNSVHLEGEHSKGAHLSGDNSGDISFHHNLLAHNMDRNPQPTNPGILDMRNNVIYNWGKKATYVSNSKGTPYVNIVGNYYKAGPDRAWTYEVARYIGDSTQGHSIYVKGNIGPNRLTDLLPEYDMVQPDSRYTLVQTAHPAAAVTTTSAGQAYLDVTAGAGATVPYRDPVDARIMNEVQNGTGSIIDHENQVGGWPTLPAGTTPVDSDNDGMPDAWETARGLNPSVNDSAGDRNGDGYTNIEEYFNLLAP